MNMYRHTKTMVSSKNKKDKQVPSLDEFIRIYNEIDHKYEEALKELARR